MSKRRKIARLQQSAQFCFQFPLSNGKFLSSKLRYLAFNGLYPLQKPIGNMGLSGADEEEGSLIKPSFLL